MNRFNPRLRPFDVALLVGLLAVLAPSLPFVIRTIFPGADIQVGIRLAFSIAIGALFMRMKYFPSPHVEERPVSPSARLLSVVLFGFGGSGYGAWCVNFRSDELRAKAAHGHTLAPNALRRYDDRGRGYLERCVRSSLVGIGVWFTKLSSE